MSTSKTPNYQLHSWIPNDEFHVTEINENFTKLDASLKAESSALAAALGQKVEIVVGKYEHTNAENLTVSLGRKPTAVLIENYRGARGLNDPYGILLTDINVTQYATLTEDGFMILRQNYLNSSSGSHIYLAFFLN